MRLTFQRDLNVTEDDMLEAKEFAATLSLEEVRVVCSPTNLDESS